MTTTVGDQATGRRRGVVVVLAILVGLLLVAFVVGRPSRAGPPLDPRSDAPLGTSAHVEVHRRLDADVELSVGLPDEDDDVALVLADELTDDQRQQLQDWTRAGGRLIVASPGPMTPQPVQASVLDPGTEVVEPGACSIEALSGLGPVDTGGGVLLEVPTGAELCFGDGDGAYVVASELGEGTVVAIGGPLFAVNDLLDEADNAALAAALLAPEPGTAVRFVEPPIPAGGGDKTLLELAAPGVRRAVIQLGIAFVLYAIWRAIRLGRPIVEEQPVPIAGSELVAAVGRLLSRTRSPAAAADLVRADLRRELVGRLGLPPDASADAIADAVSERTGADRATVHAAVTDTPVTTDQELLALTQAAAAVRQEVFR